MNLSKAQRVELLAKYGGKCAYCGVPLGKGWHADHLEPIKRQMKWVRWLTKLAQEPSSRNRT